MRNKFYTGTYSGQWCGCRKIYLYCRARKTVREAFEKDFSKRQLPMGIVAIEGTLREYASPVQKVRT